MSSRFVGYGPWCGEVAHRERGSLVSMESGLATGYSLENLQARGTLFVSPMDPVYAGMIVGEHSRADDLACNPTKTKKLGNYRAETKEIDVGLKVPREMTLDQALEWIAADELVEVTPKIGARTQGRPGREDRKKANRSWPPGREPERPRRRRKGPSSAPARSDRRALRPGAHPPRRPHPHLSSEDGYRRPGAHTRVEE